MQQIYHKSRTYTLLPGTILSWCCFVRLNFLKKAGNLSFALDDLEETLMGGKKKVLCVRLNSVAQAELRC